MSDSDQVKTILKKIRNRINAIVEPLNLHICKFEMETKLGTYTDSTSDKLHIVFNIHITRTDEFPRQYIDNSWRFYGGGDTIEEAIKHLLSNLNKHVPEWEKMIREDNEVASLVGRRLRSLKRDSYYVRDNESPYVVKRKTVWIPVGTEVEVIKHISGGIVVKRVDEDDAVFSVATWKMYNTYYKTATEQNIPDPYYEVVTDGGE